MDLGSVIIPS